MIDYCQELANSSRYKGCIIQRVLRPHQALAALAGNRVSGVRVGVVWGNGSPEVYRAVLRLAHALPDMRLLGVDVAVTDIGPVVLEINYPGDFDLLQIAAQRGVMAEDGFRRIYA